MSGGYSNDPRAYGLPIDYWHATEKGRDLLAEVERVNTPKPGEKWAEADFIHDPERKPHVPESP